MEVGWRRGWAGQDISKALSYDVAIEGGAPQDDTTAYHFVGLEKSQVQVLALV
jgi:hypothetical protein